MVRIDKRIILGLLVTLFIGLSFWLGSRYPSLGNKAGMGIMAGLEPLGFDQVFSFSEDAPFWKKVTYTFINWVETNKRGMMFGLLLAACILTLLSQVKRKYFNNRFLNTLIGIGIGAPLGVCVNCAAPIARGLHLGGMRLETTLSAMISSPTLNIVILSMLFTMFPWYMGVIKLSLTFILLLVIIPLLCRYIFTNQTTLTDINFDNENCSVPQDIENETWLQTSKWFIANYFLNLRNIIKSTVPLMIMAGLLGALIITLLPWEDIVGFLPQEVFSRKRNMAIIFGLAIFGLFLPVPISFDLILTSILIGKGVPIAYAMTLLFTLGTFSVISFGVVWSSISRQVAIILTLVILVLGVASSGLAFYGNKWSQYHTDKLILKALTHSEPFERESYELPPGAPWTEVHSLLKTNTLTAVDVNIEPHNDVSIQKIPFQPRSLYRGGKLFTRFDGKAFNLTAPASASKGHNDYTVLRFIPPFYHGRAIASGDMNNDGRVDLVVSEELGQNGFSLYANYQGKKFLKQKINIPWLTNKYVMYLALVDLNNDGWLDIFFSIYGKGNYVAYNKQGAFSETNTKQVFQPQSFGVSHSNAFGDINRDGLLDIIVGNWSIGYLINLKSESSGSGGELPGAQNYVLMHQNGEFKPRPLNGVLGETLTTLLSDYNFDGHLDLIVGNDFQPHDTYFTGDSTGHFEPVRNSNPLIPHSTDYTMSLASGDLNNDILPEIYAVQIAMGKGEEYFSSLAENLKPYGEICQEFKDPEAKNQCSLKTQLYSDLIDSRSTSNISFCFKIKNPKLQQDCFFVHLLWKTRIDRDPKFCKKIPSHQKIFSQICETIAHKRLAPGKTLEEIGKQSVHDYNILLTRPTNDGSFVDIGRKSVLGLTGWAWNAKFADLDNDEWQDIYVATGAHPFGPDTRVSNLFFHNIIQQHTDHNLTEDWFKEDTQAFGLSDFMPTSAYTYIDFDHDGDLDIISLPTSAPIRVFVNNSESKYNSIGILLRDEQGNHFGIGSKIIIHYGSNSKLKQLREIQASGGFMSTDAPRAYFGLGDHKHINKLEIHWSTGEKMMIDRKFTSGAVYTITRKKISPILNTKLQNQKSESSNSLKNKNQHQIIEI